uniref:Uncharacterized protein n=1 Tax=Nelumbo nucifera TaxID=4432 RepID=A0A822YX31_NELNU|nr:TPA_asm: hypothetical protein HUJ06_007711 [Nelumbo nucifera]
MAHVRGSLGDLNRPLHSQTQNVLRKITDFTDLDTYEFSFTNRNVEKKTAIVDAKTERSGGKLRSTPTRRNDRGEERRLLTRRLNERQRRWSSVMKERKVQF